MKKLILILCLFGITATYAQAPKQHIFYDTVRIVKERVDFSPDTIPVYFKELIITEHQESENPNAIVANDVYEHWAKGYVIWQTYVKTARDAIYGITGNSYFGASTFNQTAYYKNDFQPSRTSEGTFLYSDRKTKVNNIVTFTVKR